MKLMAPVRYAGLAAVVFATVVAVASIAPPAPLPIDATLTEFSAGRAAVHQRTIAREPHPVGSPAHEAVRAYLLRVFGELGLETQVIDRPEAARLAGSVFSARVQTVVARLPGTRRGEKAVALVAHYDSVPQSHGASDDGSGVATLLETARALRARAALADEVLFVMTDGEELALLGAQSVMDDPAIGPRIGVALNFDARGTGGAVAMYDPSLESGELIRLLGDVAPRPIASSFVSALARALPNDSDVTIFKRAGLPALGFAYADGLEDYHRSTDDADHADRASLQHDGSYALALTSALGDRNLDALKASDVVYFDLLGRLLIHYPEWFARILAFATIVFYGVLFGEGLRRRALTPRGVARGAGMFLAGVVLSAAASAAMQAGVAHFIDLHTLLARAKLVTGQSLLASAAILLALWSRPIRRGRAAELSFGALGVWALLLAVAMIAAPALTPPLEWPFLGALFAARTTIGLGRPRDAWLGALPAAVMLATLVYSVAVAVGGTMAFAPTACFALGAGLLVPALATTEPRERRGAAAACLGLSLVAATVAILEPAYGAGRPRADSLVYGVDADTGRATFFTYDRAPDEYVGRTVKPGYSVGPLPALTRLARPLAWVEAPVFPYTAGEATVVSDEMRAGVRALVVRVHVPQTARCVRIWDEGDSVLRATSIDGAPVRDLVRFSPERDETLLRWAIGDLSRRAFHMRHCGLRGAFDVALDVRAGERAHLRVVAESDGLPASVEARPPATVPAEESDVTLVSGSFAL
jgi:Peptidase family M28